MSTHELAKKLLEMDDKPVVISTSCAQNTISSTDEEGQPLPDITIREEEDSIRIDAWIPDSNFGWMD